MTLSLAATSTSRDLQLRDLASRARELADLIDALDARTIIALDAEGWNHGDGLESADLHRAADCAERAMEQGGIFLPR
jgi:hypothetical protein